MEIMEFMRQFIRQKERMCEYYVDGCTRDGFREICPAHDMDCEITTDKLEQLVAVVEQWAKEHPEKPEQERQKPEQEREQERPKRTNKDVLLAAFQDARVEDDGIPVACPLALDAQYDCNEFKNCSVCRRAHWLAEAQE